MKISKKASLQKKFEFYKVLHKLPQNVFRHIIEHLDNDSVDLICECVYNVLYTDLKLSTKTKNALKNKLHKHCCLKNLKMISNKKLSVSKRKKALMQEGEGIGLILSAIIPLLTKLFMK